MTNPDNVGGLPPLPESLNSVYIIPREGGVSVENPFSDYYSVDQMRAYGELCRAAPAGGDVPCDMGEMCLGCTPRNADGSCPDAATAGGEDLRYGLRLNSALTEELRILGVDYDPADTSVGIMSDCWHPSTSDLSMALGAAMGRIKPDSAPAGSGEVEKLVRSARAIIDHAVHGEPVPLQDAHDKLTEASALLRKLQQGAE